MSLDKILRLTRADMYCIEKGILYIDLHYMDKISAEHLSLEITLSKDKLQAGFQKKTGFTLHEYIVRVPVFDLFPYIPIIHWKWMDFYFP
ncbi:MAG TPA: hypothetical protein VNS58_01020 [Puia sp.]|nr:hypothetical protein [Puia sp.]